MTRVRIPPYDDCHHTGGLTDARVHRELALRERDSRLRNLRAALRAKLLADKLDAALVHQRRINTGIVDRRGRRGSRADRVPKARR